MKKGFTLVEIIISIGLIVLVGTVSIVSFNLIKKHNKEKTLNNMSDEILTALRLYIETNDEAKSKIYEDYEGMAITLKSLENEGLIEFPSNLNIESRQDYVVAMLSNESDCSDITTVESWDLTNGPLYICSKGGTQNLFAVGGDATNLSQGTREPYYFRGTNPKNYIQLNGAGTKYRIISIERDDSLILYSGESFGDVFNGKTMDISYTTDFVRNLEVVCENSNLFLREFNLSSDNTEQKIDNFDFQNTAVCQSSITTDSPSSNFASSPVEKISAKSWLGTLGLYGYQNNSFAAAPYADWYVFTYETEVSSGYKIHLNSCMKITGGTGDFATPYILSNKCP